MCGGENLPLGAAGRDHYPLCATSISVVNGALSRNSWGEEWLSAGSVGRKGGVKEVERGKERRREGLWR